MKNYQWILVGAGLIIAVNVVFDQLITPRLLSAFRPAPFVATATYLHLCDMALGEIKWIGGVPLCFIDLRKYRDAPSNAPP